MDSIYRLFTGHFIDLSKIISINNIRFFYPHLNSMEVLVTIDFQLRENTMVFKHSTIVVNSLDTQLQEENYFNLYNQFIQDCKQYKNELECPMKPLTINTKS